MSEQRRAPACRRVEPGDAIALASVVLLDVVVARIVTPSMHMARTSELIVEASAELIVATTVVPSMVKASHESSSVDDNQAGHHADRLNNVVISICAELVMCAVLVAMRMTAVS